MGPLSRLSLGPAPGCCGMQLRARGLQGVVHGEAQRQLDGGGARVHLGAVRVHAQLKYKR